MSEITKAEIRQKLGNIKQLQELLFGEKTKEYDRQINSLQARLDRLESDRHQSQSIIDERLEQLENKLIERINSVSNSLEQKIQYFNTDNKKEQQQIKTDLELVAKQTRDSIDYLQDSIKTQNSNFEAEITQSKVVLNEEMRLVKQQITEKLNSSLSKLSTGKVSRSDLAEVLFEISLKLKNLENKSSEI